MTDLPIIQPMEEMRRFFIVFGTKIVKLNKVYYTLIHPKMWQDISIDTILFSKYGLVVLVWINQSYLELAALTFWKYLDPPFPIEISVNRSFSSAIFENPGISSLCAIWLDETLGSP